MKLFTRNFLANEAASGVLMMLAAGVALVLANSAVADGYQHVVHLPMPGGFTLSHFVKDVLMPIFFLMVGLELKSEMLVGNLAARGQKTLPLLAAAGGVMVPALIYLAITRDHPELAAGWAIPTATDIAFAVCVLRLVGSAVPPAAKSFLLAIAIYDDLAASLIVAFFYSAGVALVPLAAAAILSAALYGLNRAGVGRLTPYLLLGVGLWVALFYAGIHPTVAGVITAVAVPLRTIAGTTPLSTLMHGLHPTVAFGILPLFAFVSAGISVGSMDAQTLLGPLPLAIIVGLALGKPIGIFAATWATVRLGLATLPAQTSWRLVFAMGVVAGIGFTMSFFIGQLAFTDDTHQTQVKLGVMVGSLASALIGFALLRRGQAIP
jgi:NhaA family Na+:H+ antiporter